ncbi:hypothetical protein SAMN05446037_100254 [Anaerovirgula multivorans]|uniref:Haemolysin XhlA n=1 Tax=Anaerovirgula multivorans TaxID=312168 RepID=A0A239AHV1_9FIRM|nr:hypothetical protein [Anaerovirgula multivorans]SNR95215.1 hypothetical protein SAMN05446037_100254 [Anaerovirgula multivorans]
MLCERHGEITEDIKDHEKRISKLEISDATMNEKLTTLFKKIDELTTWIKALVMLGGTTLLGFFFWYIQGLGGS